MKLNIKLRLMTSLCWLLFIHQISGQSKVVNDQVIQSNDGTKTYIIVKSLTIKSTNTQSIVFTATATDSYVFKLANANQKDIPESVDHNFVRTETIRVAGITQETSIKDLNASQKSTSYKYADGLGRPLQEVNVQASPTQNDIIQPFAFDDFGRQEFEYLPYAIANSRGSYRSGALSSELFNFFSGTYRVAVDSRPYNKKVFDDSPLNQVRSNSGPGFVWQNNSKSIQSNTKVDLSGSIIKWTYNGETVAPTASTYPAKSLVVNEVIDEQGVVTQEYKDFRGLTVLSVRDASSMALKTYNIYDAAGKLCVVIPPEAVERIGTEYTTATNAQRIQFLNRWAFQYVYDANGHLIKKRAPGMLYTADQTYWNLFVYDKWDRLVLTREPGWDANQWVFTKYDVFNRPVLTGIYTTTTSHTQLLADAMNSNRREETPVPNNVTGYTITNTFPYGISESDLRSVTYYDNYDFIYSGWDAENGASTYSYFNESNFPSSSAKLGTVRGYTTGSKVRVLGDSRWLNSVIYYDTKYRILQTIGENYKGGRDRVTNLYDFVKVLRTKQVHTSSAENITVLKEFTYDHADRLLTVKQTTANGSPVILVSNKYNEAGQLIEENLHSVDNGNSFLQSVDYKYNIRGWITNINNGTLTNDGYNDDSNDLFGMDLLYTEGETINSIATSPRYNGNISAIRWKTNNLVDTPKERVFGFNYDALNRLVTNRYAEKNGVGGWAAYVDQYTEGMTYDKNGNIKGLQRYMDYGGVRALVDNLSYKYGSNSAGHDNNGNRLYNVHDSSPYFNIDDKNSAYGFAEKSHDPLLEEYGYDNSGRLTSDLNKEITSISYNYLNMPTLIQLSNNRRIEYTYDATGNKLKTVVKDNGTVIHQTEYVGSFHYVNGTLAYILTDHGRAVRNNDNVFEYEYNLKDHQDNTRVVFGSMRETKEYRATMEPSLDDLERNTYGFKNITNTRTQMFNHTPKSAQLFAPDRSAETNGFLNKAVGPAKILAVSNGDRLQVEVFARYNTGIASSTTLINNLASVVPLSFGLTTGETAYNALYNNVPGQAATIPFNGTVAKAYVCYLLFDNNYVFRQFGFSPISPQAAIGHQRLFVDAIMNWSGYAFVYVANESNVSSATSVYFDDLLIIHERKNTSVLQVMQTSDYLPFGLAFNEYYQSRTGGALNSSYSQNRYKFQGQEKQTGFDLGWYHFKYRMHDPAIGRFGLVDPLADKYTYNSTYAFSENRLIDGVELEGAEWQWAFSSFARNYLSYVDANSHNWDSGWGTGGVNMFSDWLSNRVSTYGQFATGRFDYEREKNAFNEKSGAYSDEVGMPDLQKNMLYYSEQGKNVATQVESYSTILSDALTAQAILQGGALLYRPRLFLGSAPRGVNAFANASENATKTSTSLGAGRTGVKQWLQNAGNLERGELIQNIESVGFKRMSPSSSPVSVFERGGMRIRLDPPQSGTPFNHMHLEYGGNSYNTLLNPVHYKSPAAHIPIR